MIIKYFKDYTEAINEGLIKTHDPKVVLNTTLHRLINFNVNGELIKSNANDKIKITISDINKLNFIEIETIFDVLSENIVNLGGFFTSLIEVENLHNNKNIIKVDLYDVIPNKNYYKNIEIVYESKFNKVETDIPDKLYHLSIVEYENKILKSGLIPKTKSKLSEHSDRIYLCKSIDECNKLIKQMDRFYDMEKDQNMYVVNKKKYKKDTRPVIFEIDNSNNIINNLYIDPNYIGGYFSIDCIPPENIKIIN